MNCAYIPLTPTYCMQKSNEVDPPFSEEFLKASFENLQLKRL